jgi:hypothetical protein
MIDAKQAIARKNRFEHHSCRMTVNPEVAAIWGRERLGDNTTELQRMVREKSG